MPTTLLQSTAADVSVFLETLGGSGATGVVSAAISAKIKKASDPFFTPLALTDAGNAAATVGTGVDGTVTLEVPGTAGNLYTVAVTVPGGTSPLTVTKSGATLTIALAVSVGIPVTASNTAALVATAVNALGGEIVATASGTGADSLSLAEGPTTLTGGTDGSLTALGSGFYSISLTSANTDTVGNLYLQVTGAGLRSLAEGFYVAAATSLGATTTPTTEVFGTILNVSGQPVVGAAVTFKPVPVPTIVHPGNFGLGIDSSIITVTTDTDGYFVASLITGTAVVVSIPVLGYSRTIRVPASASSDLFSL